MRWWSFGSDQMVWRLTPKKHCAGILTPLWFPSTRVSVSQTGHREKLLKRQKVVLRAEPVGKNYWLNLPFID